MGWRRNPDADRARRARGHAGVSPTLSGADVLPTSRRGDGWRDVSGARRHVYGHAETESVALEQATEREILEGCRARDPVAAEAMVLRHQAPLARSVLRLVRRRSVAEEIVQEAFLRLFRDIDRVDPDRGARSLLFRIAFNL